MCRAPYLLVTGCSDSTVRFWSCELAGADVELNPLYVWTDWTSVSCTEHITVPGIGLVFDYIWANFSDSRGDAVHGMHP